MINSVQKNSPYFTSTPLHSIKLKKITNGAQKGYASAVVSKLDPSSAKDKNALEGIKQGWGKGLGLVQAVCRSFFDEKAEHIEFYAVELNNKKMLAERIIGLTKSVFLMDGENKNLYLWAMTAKPEVGFKNAQRKVTGVGECLMNEIFYSAKNNHANNISFNTDNKSFYEKSFRAAGIKFLENKNELSGNYGFFINEKDFDKYINYCQEKYKINF